MILLDLTDVLAIAAHVWDEQTDVVVARSDLDAIELTLDEARTYSDCADVAGALLTGLVARRPFPVRNRRIAVAVTVYFLAANEQELDLEPAELDRLLDDVATGAQPASHAAVWLRVRLSEGNGQIASYERFSGPARRVLGLAREAARELGHGMVGTEHILLGLLEERDGIAAKALRGLTLSAEQVRAQIEVVLGRASTASTENGEIPFTARAKQLLQHAVVAADRLRRIDIDTEHLLLGLVREGEGTAAKVLARLGAAPYDVTRQIFRGLAGDGPAASGMEAQWWGGDSMFERFNDRARRVVVLAQEEARMLGHNYIGTEHVLLGIVHDDRGLAGTLLHQRGVTSTTVRNQVDEIVGRGQHTPGGHIPFTPRAKKVLELGLREALHLGDNYIGDEHLLLGMIREREGVAVQALVKLDVDLVELGQRLVEKHDEGSGRRGRRGKGRRWSDFEQERAAMPAGDPNVYSALSGQRPRRAVREIEELYDEVEWLRLENVRLRALLREHGVGPEDIDDETGRTGPNGPDVRREDDDD